MLARNSSIYAAVSAPDILEISEISERSFCTAGSAVAKRCLTVRYQLWTPLVPDETLVQTFYRSVYAPVKKFRIFPDISTVPIFFSGFSVIVYSPGNTRAIQ